MTSWWSKSILAVGIAAVVVVPLGALGARFELWDYVVGFALFQLGGLLGLIGVGCGIPGIVVARRRLHGRDLWVVASGLAASFALVVFLGMHLLRAVSAPPIYQVSTNTEDPPQYNVIVALRGENSNSLELDAAMVETIQEEHYPWMEPFFMRATPTEALAKALEVLEAMGMEVVATHSEDGLIEAVDSTFWFAFKDDVAVRIREFPGGSVVDVRSASRVGISDVGTNAKRAKEVLRRLKRD